MRKTKENIQGITLIALVVTIVVLLILAAVSISLLTGEKGIITQAQDAKENTDIGNEKEIVNLAATGAKTRDVSGEIKEDNLRNELDQLIGEGKYDLTGTGPYTVTYKESGRSYIVEANGNIIDNEEYEKKALKFLVNSGEDGTVVLPIYEGDEGTLYQVDWGDGTKGKDNKYYADTKTKKLASLDNTKIAARPGRGITHIFEEKNKEFIVTITGKCDGISSSLSNVTKDKIIEIVQWGETGLESIYLGECTKLRKIASPSENSFNKIESDGATGFENAFSGCTSLTEIPEDLFSNCPQVTSFRETFKSCTNLTEIPTNLFSNCLNVKSFFWTFANCTALTGEAPKLWERVPNGAENEYVGTPSGSCCFLNATGLSNYNDIPESWKIIPR